MAEVYGFGITAMLTANAHLETAVCLAYFADRDAHERSNTIFIDAHERVGRQQSVQNISRQEFPGVIARQPKTRLR